jgi:uncharacterized alkaline shock family protein YloU
MQGDVQIARPVLASIVELTALATPGVAKMHRQGRPAILRGGGRPAGVRLAIVEGAVEASVSIVVEPTANILEVGRAVQRGVARALHDMAGMDVREINVYIQDVEGGQ